MPDIVIKAENLGKKYVIGHQAERGGYTALRDVWEIGGHDAASCPPISPIHAHPEPVEGSQEDVPGFTRM
jgi:hypothetical protein